MHLAAEIIGGGGESAPAAFGDGFGRADLPFAADIGLRQRIPFVGDHEEAQTGIIGFGNFLLRVAGHAAAQFHVRLAGTAPALADHHVVKFDRAGTGHFEDERAAGFHGGEARFPFAALIGLRLGGGGAERHGDCFIRLGPAPNCQGHLLLENHVAAEHFGQHHLGPGRGQSRPARQERRRQTNHPKNL